MSGAICLDRVPESSSLRGDMENKKTGISKSEDLKPFVPAEASIKEFSKAINRYAGVTHNYLRDDPYNIWFTFIAQSMEEIEAHIEKISEETGIKDILNLPAVKIYKIRAHFNL